MNNYLRYITRIATLAGGIAAAGTGYMLFEAQWLRFQRRQLLVQGLPQQLDGLKLLHVSDLHAGAPGTNDLAIARFVGAAMNAGADMILFTGDMTDKQRDLSPYISRLASLDAPYGKFAVLGNHDHGVRKTVLQDLVRRFTGRSQFRPFVDTDPSRTVKRNRMLMMEAGIWLLDNECVHVTVGDDRIQICGIDDYQYGYARLDQVRQQLDPGAGLRILLSHSPDAVKEAGSDFQLVLAGHTHGGQICIPHPGKGKVMLSSSGSEFGEGIYRVNGTTLHVSRGVGTTLVPFRLLTRPEITLLELHAGKNQAGSGIIT